MGIVRDGTGPRGLAKEVVQLTASTTINSSHAGRVLQCNSGSTVTLTLPNDLAPGFGCDVEQVGAGAVAFTAGTNATVRQRTGSAETSGQYARARVEVATNTLRNNAVWTLSGDISGLAPSDALKADAAITISAGGIASGGGDLTANRTITVTKATGAEAETGSNDTKAVTPLALAPRRWRSRPRWRALPSPERRQLQQQRQQPIPRSWRPRSSRPQRIT